MDRPPTCKQTVAHSRTPGPSPSSHHRIWIEPPPPPPRDVLEAGEGRGGLKGEGEGGLAGTPLLPGSPDGPRHRRAKKFFKLKSSWHRSKILVVSLKHWKGRRGGVQGGGGGRYPLFSYGVRPFYYITPPPQ